MGQAEVTLCSSHCVHQSVTGPRNAAALMAATWVSARHDEATGPIHSVISKVSGCSVLYLGTRRLSAVEVPGCLVQGLRYLECSIKSLWYLEAQ